MVGNHILDQLWTLLNKVKPSELSAHFEKLNFKIRSDTPEVVSFIEKVEKPDFFMINMLESQIHFVIYKSVKSYDYESFFQYAKNNFNFEELEKHVDAIRNGFVLSMLKLKDPKTTTITLRKGERQPKNQIFEVLMMPPPPVGKQ